MYTINKTLQPAHQRWARSAIALSAIAALAACSSVPERNAALDQARTRHQAVQSQDAVMRFAPDELKRATEALRVAEQAQASREPVASVDHLAYLASQRVSLAQDSANSRAAQAVTASAGSERERMRLTLRTQEADAAKQQLAASQQSNAVTRQDLASAQRSNDLAAAALADAGAKAQADRERLARREAEVGDLQAQLAEMNARKTDRGVVVTLGDMLFDTGRSELKGSSASTIDKLAEFIKRNPQRRAAIEGHTDSVGSAGSNQDLSERRARSVVQALQLQGVPPDQLSTQSYGEERPVGDNATVAGRQTNRRVEVIFDPTAGDVLIK
jgi:outer membrane protein OmpA-like peptidoglycan-associated protein